MLCGEELGLQLGIITDTENLGWGTLNAMNFNSGTITGL